MSLDELNRPLNDEEQAVLRRALEPFQRDVLELIRKFGKDCEPVGHHLAIIGIVEVLHSQMAGVLRLRPELRSHFLSYIATLRLMVEAEGATRQ